MEKIYIKGNADVGNSSTKIIVIEGVLKKARKQPTVASFLPTVPSFEDDALNVLVSNLHKNMVVHVTSKSVKRNGLYAIGDYANDSEGKGFNIKHHNKAEQDLTIIQPLTMIATSVIQNKFIEKGELPESLAITMDYTTAIPVVDYTKKNANELENRLIGNHILTIYVNEEHQVHVDITVRGAKVVQEGLPVVYALGGASPDIFKEYNERYNVQYTGRDLITRKLLLVDIGDGTEELIYIVDGKPVLTKSHGLRLGVGHASEKALMSFKEQNGFRTALTRSTFMAKVLDERDKWHDECKSELALATFEQEEEIYSSIVDTIENRLLNDVDDVVVFGGGTNVFTDLKTRLYDYTDTYKMRMLWITGKTASLMNALGLGELGDKVFFK